MLEYRVGMENSFHVLIIIVFGLLCINENRNKKFILMETEAHSCQDLIPLTWYSDSPLFPYYFHFYSIIQMHT